MKEEFIYMCNVRNKHTGTYYVKLGYTNDILQRMNQLQNRNVHYEYSNFRLFKHQAKTIGYIHDEQRIHSTNKKYRGYLKREWMPEGYTECYEYAYSYDLAQQLSIIGYECVYDEQKFQQQKVQAMFEWN